MDLAPPHRYAFGDSAVASRRLAVLASVFAPTSTRLLGSLGLRPPGLVLDLGCGPGHTTSMLAEAFPTALVVGIDTSAAFVAEAGASSPPRCRFVVGDVTRRPLPCAPAHVVYGRFLLVHLPDPRGAVRRWAGDLAPGGVVVVEEPQRIDTDDPDFRRYLELATAVVADRGGDLYVGGALVDLEPAPGTSIVVQHEVPLDVRAGAAADIFSLNLSIWGDDAALGALVAPGEVAALSTRLAERRADDATGVIGWHMRQVVMARPG